MNIVEHEQIIHVAVVKPGHSTNVSLVIFHIIFYILLFSSIIYTLCTVIGI